MQQSSADSTGKPKQSQLKSENLRSKKRIEEAQTEIERLKKHLQQQQPLQQQQQTVKKEANELLNPTESCQSPLITIKTEQIDQIKKSPQSQTPNDSLIKELKEQNKKLQERRLLGEHEARMTAMCGGHVRLQTRRKSCDLGDRGAVLDT